MEMAMMMDDHIDGDDDVDIIFETMTTTTNLFCSVLVHDHDNDLLVSVFTVSNASEREKFLTSADFQTSLL
eukprot:739223-Hanusia_phi.AAC.1